MYNNSKVVLCSFADTSLIDSALRFKNQAKSLKFLNSNEGNMGGGKYFDDILIYTEDSLPLKFKEDFKDKFFDNKGKKTRGFGYWCWKPQVIFSTLMQLNDDDFLVYADIGYEFANGFDEIFIKMLDYTKNHQISACRTSHLSKLWNKADLLNHFNLLSDEKFLNSYQIEAGLVFIKKNDFTVKFIKEWLSYFYTIFHLIDDTKSILPEAEYFRENRHDQSILSILFYKYSLNTFNFKVREYNENTGAPFLLNRNKNQIDFTKCIQEQENGTLVYTSPFIVRGVLFESEQEQTLINITLNKTATQSSTSKWSKPNDATRALLGESTNGDFAFHTAEEENPWWMVDLEKEEYIYNIYIQNRIKMCKEKAKTLQIEISLDKENWILIPNECLKWNNLDYLNIELLNKYKARYVKLSLQEKQYFHLAKVEIYALNDKVVKACRNLGTYGSSISSSGINNNLKLDIVQILNKQNEILNKLV